jgi:hypothetical protein
MRTWFALFVAPLAALADQSIAFAAVGWACAHQLPIAVHTVHAVFLIITAGATAAAWHVWRAAQPTKSRDGTMARQHFMAGLASALGALSAAAIIAMWIPAWVIAPCSI